MGLRPEMVFSFLECMKGVRGEGAIVKQRAEVVFIYSSIEDKGCGSAGGSIRNCRKIRKLS